MLDDGVRTFVEIGPKRLLSTFNQATADARGIKIHCFHVEDVASLDVFLSEMDKQPS